MCHGGLPFFTPPPLLIQQPLWHTPRSNLYKMTLFSAFARPLSASGNLRFVGVHGGGGGIKELLKKLWGEINGEVQGRDQRGDSVGAPLRSALSSPLSRVYLWFVDEQRRTRMNNNEQQRTIIISFFHFGSPFPCTLSDLLLTSTLRI